MAKTLHHCFTCLMIICTCFMGFNARVNAAVTFGECTGAQGDKSSKHVASAQCAILTIAENPKAPNERQLNIHVLRIPAISETPESPIFFIAGGPGQAAEDIAPTIRQQLRTINQTRDLVFVDQRGTGKSAPLKCEFDEPQLAQLPHHQRVEHFVNALEKCVKGYEADLRFYTTNYAVDDLEYVRQALNYPKINLWGGSYGTRVALRYIRRYPDAIRSAVIDGVAPLELSMPYHIDNDASMAAEKLFAQCDASACQKAFGSLKQQWLKLLNQTENTPEKARVQTFSHPRSEQAEIVYIDTFTLSQWLRFALYSRQLMPLLPLAIHEAANGDLKLLYSLAAIGADKAEDNISMGMHFSVICNEDRGYAKQHKLTPESADLVLRVGSEIQYQSACQHFPNSVFDKSYFEPIVSDVPVLILSGQFDPVTPERWGEYVHNNFANSQHITVSGGHHIATGLGCIPDILSQFYQSTQMKNIDISCIEKIKPAPFFIDGAGPNLSPDTSSVLKP